MYLHSDRIKPWTAVLIVSALASACGDSDDDPIDEGLGGSSAGVGGGGTGGTQATGGAGGSTGGNKPSGGDNAGGGTDASTGGTDASGGSSEAGSSGSGQAGGESGGVPLGSAEDFAILAKSGISTVPTSAVTGNLGVSPAAASYVTGFSLTADSTNRFSTSEQVTGKIYAADDASPTPADMTTAVGDMELAFTDAAGRAPDVTELGAGDIGGMTLEPGVYQWGTGLLIPTDVTLAGSKTSTWIFQIAQDLIVGNGTRIVLSGGATPKNVVWQVAGKVSLGTTAHFEGIVLSQTAISLGTGASINGRLLAQTAVTLDGNAVVEPTP
jgi:hypothetical protein